jgi:hypothetical protein
MNNGGYSTPPLIRCVTVILRPDQIDTVHIYIYIYIYTVQALQRGFRLE